MERNKVGKFRFTEGKGNTVINYMIEEREIRKKIERMKIGNRVGSDHHPVIKSFERNGKKKEGKEGTKNAEKFGMEREKKV